MSTKSWSESVRSWLDERVDRVVRQRIFLQPKAAGFAWSSYAEAESSGENAVFERALRRATDESIRKMIAKHQEDEIRHAAMLDARREQLGLKAWSVPEHLKLVDRLSEAAGHVLDRPMDRDEDVAAVYALLYVIEERAIEVFGRSIDACTAIGDYESAGLFRRIQADEERHLKYCRAVGRRYSGSDEAFEREVEAVRDVERVVYAKTSRGFFAWMLSHDLLELPFWLGVPLRAALRAADRWSLPAPRLTSRVVAA